MTKETYNGWINYETWRVNLEICADYFDSNHEDLSKLKAHEVAEILKDYCQEVLDMEESGTFCKSYAESFLAKVNFYEIAEAHLEG